MTYHQRHLYDERTAKLIASIGEDQLYATKAWRFFTVVGGEFGQVLTEEEADIWLSEHNQGKTLAAIMQGSNESVNLCFPVSRYAHYLLKRQAANSGRKFNSVASELLEEAILERYA